jgi:hypothetical protein
MNIGLREYLVEVWVTASPEFLLSPIVSDLNRCSRTQSMQTEDAMQTHCRWSSRSLVVDVEEVVVRRWHRGSSRTGASSRVKTLPENLIARLFRAGSQQQDEVPEALLSPVPCARCKRWRCKRKQQTEREERGLLSRSTWFLNWQSEGEEEGLLI